MGIRKSKKDRLRGSEKSQERRLLERVAFMQACYRSAFSHRLKWKQHRKQWC